MNTTSPRLSLERRSWISHAFRALCFAAVLAPGVLHAQAYPSKPIRLVVGFAPGGSTDVTARLIGQALSERLGQPLIVENRPGAGGNIAAESVARAEPDGYTLFFASSGTVVTNPSLYKNIPFDTLKDFAPISQTAFIPNLLVVNPSVPANSIPELLDYAKANPGKLSYGSAGNGSSQHLAAELFKSLGKVDMVHVAYRGGAPAVNDLIGGQIQLLFAPLVEVLPFVEAGKLKALGVTTKQRSPALPTVQAIAETLPGFEVALWNGLMAPARTPDAIIERLHRETISALGSEEVKAKLATQGSEPAGSSPAELRAFIDTELAKWKKLVEISGATVQ